MAEEVMANVFTLVIFMWEGIQKKLSKSDRQNNMMNNENCVGRGVVIEIMIPNESKLETASILLHVKVT